MKQLVQKKITGIIPMYAGLMLCIICTVLSAGVYADTASESSAMSDSSGISRTSTFTNYDPFNPDVQNASSITQFATSTSYTETPESSSDSTSQEEEVITESILMLTNDQSAIQKINFKNSGTLIATSLSGDGFELYSKKADKYPQNVTSKSEYGTLSTVTSSEPVSVDITPGSWYFTIFPIGDTSTYDIIAIQEGSSSPTSSSTGNSYSSFVESTPNTTHYSTSSSTGSSQSSSEGLTTVAFR